MGMKNRVFRRAMALTLAAAVGVLSLASCKDDDDNKDEKDDDTEISSTVQDDGGLILSVGDVSEGDGIDLSVKKVYTAESLDVEGKAVYPEQYNIFVIAEIEVRNKTSEIIDFDCSQIIIPSLDGKVFNLNEWINVFPNYLDGMDNMLNKAYTNIPPENSTNGFIAFEAQSVFKYCDFTYHLSNKIQNVFRFINPKNADHADKELNIIASADTDEISLMALKTVQLTEYGNLPAPEYNQRYVQATVAIKNKTKKLRDSYIYGFRAKCENKEYKPIEAAEEKTYKLPPDNYSVYTLTFKFPSSAYTYDLVYTDLINDKSASVNLETWKS